MIWMNFQTWMKWSKMGKIKLNNGKQVSRHFYKGVDYDIDYEKRLVKLRPEFHNKLMSKTL